MAVCPSEEVFDKYVHQRLSEHERSDLIDHVGGCDACRELLAGTVTALLGESAGDDDHIEELGGRYRIDEVVGAGAMGLVCSAYDQTLKRLVALKLYRRVGGTDAVRLRERLVREAESMARLSHPNIITIYDAGVVGDQVFIAMELLRGGTLSSWLGSPRSWREIVEVFVQAGRGLQAAHSAGIVHRDFKPDNVLLGQDGRVCVTDFGLARLMEAVEEPAALSSLLSNGSMSASNGIVGTPAYMAPEQLRGEKVGATADQFSFCVALYEALYGVRPFAANGPAAQLDAIEQGFLLAPKRADAPVRLRAILVRGLSADPEARFPSMKALVDLLDLGERRRRRNIRIAVATTSSLALIAGVLTMNEVHGRKLTEQRAQHQLQVTQERYRWWRRVQELEAAVRFAFTQPAHDVRAEISTVRQQMQVVQGQLDKLGDIREGAGELVLGRGYLALRDPHTARVHLESALSHGYLAPEVDAALGRALGVMYQAEQQAANGIQDPILRQRKAAELRATYGPKLRALLITEGDAELTDYTKGLLALYEARWADARRHAEAALKKSPWMYEGYELIGDSHLGECEAKPDDPTALAGCDLAGVAYDHAQAIGRSDSSLFAKECARWRPILRRRTWAASPPEIEACRVAVQLDPDRVQSLLANAEHAALRSAVMISRHEDPSAVIHAAQPLLAHAAALEPKSWLVPMFAGQLHLLLAQHLSDRGSDGRPELEAALVELQKSAALGGGPDVIEAIGRAYGTLGELEMKLQLDPRKSLEQAGQYLEKAHSDHVLETLARVYFRRALYENGHGSDVMKWFDRASEAALRAQAARPDEPGPQAMLGSISYQTATYKMQTNAPPKETVATFELGAKMYEAVLARTPKDVPATGNLAALYADHAAYLNRGGHGDPTPLLKRSLALYDRLAELEQPHRSAIALGNWAIALNLAAELAIDRQQDPTRLLDQARAHLRQALLLGGNRATVLPVWSDVERCAADWAIKVGRSALPFFDRSVELSRQMMAADKTDGTWLVELGSALMYRARWKDKHGRDPSADVTEALALLRGEAAKAVFPARCLALEGCLLLLASHRQSGPAAVETRARARTELEAALKLEPYVAKEYDLQLAEARQTP